MRDKDKILVDIESKQINSTFDVVRDVMLKISGNLDEAPNFSKVFSAKTFVRTLSMDFKMIDFALLLDKLYVSGALTPREIYKFAYSAIPKRTSYYCEYIKKQPQKNDVSAINNADITIFDL